MPAFGVIMMIKNEELSIKKSIDSTKNIIKDIIIYDTGSTDRTIEIIKAACLKNNQRLHLKTGTFKTFPISRNESIEFAETVDVDNLILMDAGDELVCSIPYKELVTMVSSIPDGYKFGLVKLKWLEFGNLTEHYDIRFIKNRQGCRYNIKYPVHEQFGGFENRIIHMKQIDLYQDRDKYSGSTEARVSRDIQMLTNAEPACRNYYYLAQSYLYLKVYQNGFKYNLLALQTDNGEHGVISIYSRLGRCAIECKMDSSVVLKYLKLAIEGNENPPIEPFNNMLNYCLKNDMLDVAIPYLQQLTTLEKVYGHEFTHEDYDYKRWNLIYQICLMSKTNYDLGKKACIKAVEARGQDVDKANLKLFDMLLSKNVVPIVDKTLVKDSDKTLVKDSDKTLVKDSDKTLVKPPLVKELSPLFDDLHVFTQYSDRPMHINL